MVFREVVFPTAHLQGKNYQCMACRTMVLLSTELLSKVKDKNSFIDEELKRHICVDYGYPNRDRFYDDSHPDGKSLR